MHNRGLGGVEGRGYQRSRCWQCPSSGRLLADGDAVIQGEKERIGVSMPCQHVPTIRSLNIYGQWIALQFRQDSSTRKR